jgi:hypothetical protein
MIRKKCGTGFPIKIVFNTPDAAGVVGPKVLPRSRNKDW